APHPASVWPEHPARHRHWEIRSPCARSDRYSSAAGHRHRPENPSTPADSRHWTPPPAPADPHRSGCPAEWSAANPETAPRASAPPAARVTALQWCPTEPSPAQAAAPGHPGATAADRCTAARLPAASARSRPTAGTSAAHPPGGWTPPRHNRQRAGSNDTRTWTLPPTTAHLPCASGTSEPGQAELLPAAGQAVNGTSKALRKQGYRTRSRRTAAKL